jgi:hypothetical protein
MRSGASVARTVFWRPSLVSSTDQRKALSGAAPMAYGSAPTQGGGWVVR